MSKEVMTELLSKVELRFLYSLLGEIEDEIKRRRNTHTEQAVM